MAQYKDILRKVRKGFLDPISKGSRCSLLESSIISAINYLEDIQQGKPIWKKDAKDIDKPSDINMLESQYEIDKVIRVLFQYLEDFPVYGHPEVVLNMDPPSAIPSIIGALLAVICNPNLIEESYAGKVCQAEKDVVSLISSFIGYDEEKSSGFFHLWWHWFKFIWRKNGSSKGHQKLWRKRR